MQYTVRYVAGEYDGERTVFAEDEEHAIAKVKAWVHKQTSMPMYAEAYEVVETEDYEHESNARSSKPSNEQIQTLRAMEQHPSGRIERVPGGFWAIPGAAMIEYSRGHSAPSGWHTAVQTVRSLEKKGWVQRAHRYAEEWRDDREITAEGRTVAESHRPNRRRYTLNASELEHARNLRRTFMDREPEHEKQVPWEWPQKMQHIGQCEAVMYSSDKWKTKGQREEYKHVAEGKQDLLVAPGFVRQYDRPGEALAVVGPFVELADPMPSHFAVLANVLGVQAQLFVGDDEALDLGGEDSLYQIDIAGATLGAAKHPNTGETFLVIYTPSGVHCIVTGDVLAIEKDGIVG